MRSSREIEEKIFGGEIAASIGVSADVAASDHVAADSPSSVPAPKPDRFVNVEVLSRDGVRIASSKQLDRKRVFVLRLGIAHLSPFSLVSNPQKLPEEFIPKDVYMDVIVTSMEFEVAAIGDPYAESAVGILFLPGDGGPATFDGKEFIDFLIKASTAGIGYCHIVLKFRGAIIQSFILTKESEVGDGTGAFSVVVEFSLGSDQSKIREVPDRDRLSVLTSMRKQGFNQLIISGKNGSDAKSAIFDIKVKGLNKTIRDLRGALEGRAAISRRRSKADLERDLREIAPLGARLFNQLPAQQLKSLTPLLKESNDAVIHIARATSAEFVAPWSLIYDIPLTGKKATVCELVSKWDDLNDDLVGGDVRKCPCGPHEEDVLCPFGFWGMRYTIEQLVSTERPATAISVFDNCTIVAAQTLYDVDLNSLSAHIGSLKSIFAERFPSAVVAIGEDKDTLKTLIWQDLPILYFYCHGERANDSDPDVYLGIGNRQFITAEELTGWMWSWLKVHSKLWDKTRPLVFINACSSVGIYPETLMSYVETFIGRAEAAGVIGTEIKVNQKLAMEFAETFFRYLLTPGSTVETTLRALRLDYLKQGNLFGLVYTPYCWADLHFSVAKIEGDSDLAQAPVALRL